MIKTFSASKAIVFEFDNGKSVRFRIIDGCAVVYGPDVENKKGFQGRMCVDSFVDYLHDVSNYK